MLTVKKGILLGIGIGLGLTVTSVLTNVTFMLVLHFVGN